jgi:hypothetical protein
LLKEKLVFVIISTTHPSYYGTYIYTYVSIALQTDVAGNCDAEYIVGERGWYSVKVQKTKNLMGCMDRHGYQTAMQGTPYRVPSVSLLI